MHRPRRHFNTIQSRAPDQVADQVTDGGVGLESGGLTEGSSYLVDGGVVDSLASKNILATDELDVAAEREEPGALPAQHTAFNTLENWAIKTPPNQKGPERKGYRVMARNMYTVHSVTYKSDQ